MKPHEWFLEHRLDYATRSLDPEDARTFEAHLTRCRECQDEVARIEHELRWLPMGLPPVAPRPGLRRRIVAHVLEERPSRRRYWSLPAALAAGLLLATGGYFLGDSRSGGLRHELESQRATVAALQDTLSVMRQAGKILSADVEVDGTRGGVLIFADETTHRWNVVVHGLPPAPAGRRYQFWFICQQSTDSMVRGSEVPVDRKKPTIFTTDMPEPQSCPQVVGAALTEEPMAGDHGPPQGKPLAHLML